MLDLKKVLNAVLFVLVLISSLSCDTGQAPPNSTNRIILYDNGDLVSSQDNTIQCGWSNLSGTGSSYVAVDLRDATNSNNLGTLVYAGPFNYTASTEGSASVVWNGRRLVASLRTLPVPPGYYFFRVHFASLTDDGAVHVVANTWDSDGDDISDAVENENNKTTGVGQTPIIDVDGNTNWGWFRSDDLNFPIQIVSTLTAENPLYPNRELHDYSIARGQRTNGSFYNGLRISHSSPGRYYFSGTDDLDTDNWGVLQTVNNIEWVGREFSKAYPGSTAFGTGDISLRYGGYWASHPGGTHQQGLIVDVRYMNTDNTPINFTFNGDPSNDNHFDATKTMDLINLFIQAGATKIIVDDLTGYAATQVITLEAHGTGPHNTHFHVEFPDPDGINN